MKIYVESGASYTKKIIELEIEENETVGSIRTRVVKDNIESYKYKGYESYNPVTEKSEYWNVRLSREPISGGIKFEDGLWVFHDDTKLLKDCVGDLWQPGLTIYQNYKYRSLSAKFVCSAPNVEFEFIDEYKFYNVEMLKESFAKDFQSNCTLSLKKVGSPEYYILQDNDLLPCKNEIIFVQFEQNINIEDKMRIKFAGYDILKLTSHTPPKTVWQFADATQKPHSKDLHTTPYNYFIATGGLGGLFSAITTSYFLRNPLTESAMHSCGVLIAAALGASVGLLFGYAASYIYEYCNRPDSNSSKTPQ